MFVKIGQNVTNFYTKVVITLETSGTVDACKFFNNPGYEFMESHRNKEEMTYGTQCPRFDRRLEQFWWNL